MASTSNIGKKLKIDKAYKILTIHNVMGQHQTFNNQGYSWRIDSLYITVCRNDGKWHAYFPFANVVEAEVEELKQ